MKYIFVQRAACPAVIRPFPLQVTLPRGRVHRPAKRSVGEVVVRPRRAQDGRSALHCATAAAQPHGHGRHQEGHHKPLHWCRYRPLCQSQHGFGQIGAAHKPVECVLKGSQHPSHFFMEILRCPRAGGNQPLAHQFGSGPVTGMIVRSRPHGLRFATLNARRDGCRIGRTCGWHTGCGRVNLAAARRAALPGSPGAKTPMRLTRMSAPLDCGPPVTSALPELHRLSKMKVMATLHRSARLRANVS